MTSGYINATRVAVAHIMFLETLKNAAKLTM